MLTVNNGKLEEAVPLASLRKKGLKQEHHRIRKDFAGL
jgi:hypothetical protein